MLIKALCDYAEKQADTGIPEGWQEQGIHFRILLTPEGDVRDIVDVREPVEVPAKGGKTKTVLRPKTILLPFRTQKTAIDSNTIEHRPLYIFGLEYDAEKGFTADSPKAQKSHAAFVKHELAFFAGLDSEICLAYRRFLEKWIPEEMTKHPALLALGKEYKSAYFGFALGVGRETLEKDPQFRARYAASLADTAQPDTGTSETVCGILGERLPVARIHDKISGFPGGQSSGCVLVGMKETAFESYGKSQSYNSNVSEKAMKQYTKTLNALISDRRHYKKLGDLVLLYFAISSDDSSECSFFSDLLIDSEQDSKNAEQENYELDRLMREVQQGKLNALPEHGFDPDVTFYIAGITPNATRLCQKFIIRDHFGAVIQHLAQFQQDLRIGDSTKQISFGQIEKQLVSPKSANDKVPPPLMTALMLAAINGTRYPDGLLSTVISRVKTDMNIDTRDYQYRIRAGIIKACLNRKAKKEEIKLAWDEQNLNPAYLCGGLFAVYEKIQLDASGGGLNRTIKDAYFASACSRPASVLPKLAMLSQNHMKKLSEGSNVYYQKLLGSLMDGLACGFPATLSLDDQGRFIVGYYHMNRRLWTAAEKKEDTENA